VRKVAWPWSAQTVGSVPVARVCAFELQRVDEVANLRYVGYLVTVHDRCWLLVERGRRGETAAPRVIGSFSSAEASAELDRRLTRLRERDGYVWVTRVGPFLVTLPRNGGPEQLTAEHAGRIAAEYQRRHLRRYRPIVDLISASPRVPGPHRVLALTRFAVEARSEPVAQALTRLADVVPAHITSTGSAAFVLPSVVAAAAHRQYGPYSAVTTSAVIPDAVTAAQLDVLLTVWEPFGGTDLAFVDEAWECAQALADRPPVHPCPPPPESAAQPAGR
jgi:hypothetical protein